MAVTDASGTLISQQCYLPFGGERTNVGSISQTDYGYTGQRDLDPGMGGLMDYKARFYSPYLNRFIQPDTIVPDPSNPQAWNRFGYVHNNPLKFNDPDGHNPIIPLIFLVIAIPFLLAGDTDPNVTQKEPSESPFGDLIPDARLTSYTLTVSKGIDSNDYFVAGLDFVTRRGETRIFWSNSVDHGAEEYENLATVKPEKTPWVLPTVSVSVTKALLWGDSLKEDLDNYEGRASVVAASGNLLGVEAFSSTDPKTGKRDNKVIAVGISIGKSNFPVGAGSYYSDAYRIGIFKNHLIK